MKEEKNDQKNFSLVKIIVTDIIWMPEPDGPLRPQIIFQPLMSLKDGKECEVTKTPGYSFNFLKRLGISKGSKVEVCVNEVCVNGKIEDHIYIDKVIEPGNGDICLPQNTFIADGEVWEDTEKNRKYILFRKGLRKLLDWNEIDALFDCGITDVMSLAEYLQRSDYLTVVSDLSQNWLGSTSCLVDAAISLKQRFSKLDYFEFLKLLNLPKLRNCELKIIALTMSGYEVSDTEMKNIRKKRVEECMKNKKLINRIKAVARPMAKSELTTIVGKIGDTVTLEIKDLPKDFSFAYTFFRNIEQECRLLKKEIEKARNNGDKVIATYLESALQFFNDHPVEKNFYAGGVSISPVLDAIQTLAFKGELIFTTSVARCVRDRIDIEIDVIHQEYECCKTLSGIIPDKIDQVISIIRNAKNEEEAIEKLQSEMSLSACEAECLCSITLSTLTDRDLITQKVKSIKYLLSYLKHLRTINT